MVSDEFFELFGAAGLDFNDLFGFTVDLIVGVELLLELYDFIIALIETGSKSYDDISLLN